MPVRPLMLPLLFVALVACRDEAPAPDPGVIPVPEAEGEDAASIPVGDTCGASGWTRLIGQHRDVLAATTFPEPMRVIGPNDAVTMDFIAERLNVYYGEDDVITRVECG
ncbi:MAG: I78 family peptidase inhibitor [Pseudomonadota bacterium]